MSAPATLDVEVTADDIRLGKPSDNCECAIARAMLRLPGVDTVWAEFGCATVAFTDDERDYGFPPEATAFIQAFDAGEHVEPFTFTAALLVDEEAES